MKLYFLLLLSCLAEDNVDVHQTNDKISVYGNVNVSLVMVH